METRKKILFVITKSNWGGAQKYVYDLVTRLPIDRFEVVVAFGGTGSAGSEEGELAYRLREAKIETRFIRAFARDIRPFDEIRAFFELLSVLRKERPAIVHLNSSKAGVLGALAARIAGVPNIVFTAHGWPFLETTRAIPRAVRWCGSALTVLLSHRVICVSDFDRTRAEHMPFAKKKLTRIYNGLPPQEFIDRERARDAIVPADVAGRHARDLWVLTSAELHPNKNLSVAIDAITRFKDEHSHTATIFYVIVGDGEERAMLESEIERRRMHEHIFLAGFIPNASRYLKAFDVFVLPSRKEGLPYVLLEAGAAGLPAIASAVGGIPEIVTDGKSGFLIAPGDSAGLEAKLTMLANSTALRASLGEALQRDVASRFSIERMVEETSALY